MHAPRSAAHDGLPFSLDEIAPVLAPLEHASMLPSRAYLDESVLAFEQDSIFTPSWRCVARSRDLVLPGAWILSTVVPEGVLVVRGTDGQLRAFPNVCTHRGAPLVSASEGRSRAFVCRYHRWSFALDGAVLQAPHLPVHVPRETCALPSLAVDEWQGFVFVRPPSRPASPSLDERAPSLASCLGGLPSHLAHLDLASLRRGRRVSYEARANWKLLLENFAESHHFPSLHPELEALTPTSSARSIAASGAWQAGTMRIVDAETVSIDGRRHGRPFLSGLRDGEKDLVQDFFVWPALLLSVQPDYLLSYTVEPLDVNRTRVISEIFFPPSAFGPTGVDAADVYELWDRINAQDVDIVEHQQIGIASRSFARGRLTRLEDGVHAIDQMIAEVYAKHLRGIANTSG